MINNNGKIDQNDVQVICDTATMPNLFPKGIRYNDQNDILNFFDTPSLWAATSPHTASTITTTVYEEDGTESLNKTVRRFRMSSGSDTSNVMNVTAPSQVKPAVVGSYYNADISARWYQLPNHDSSNDDLRGEARIYACDASGNNAVLITRLVTTQFYDNGYELPSDPRESETSRLTSGYSIPVPSGKTHIKVEIGYNKGDALSPSPAYWPSAFRSSAPEVLDVWRFDVYRGTSPNPPVGGSGTNDFFKGNVPVDYTGGYAGARWKPTVPSGTTASLTFGVFGRANNTGTPGQRSSPVGIAVATVGGGVTRSRFAISMRQYETSDAGTSYPASSLINSYSPWVYGDATLKVQLPNAYKTTPHEPGWFVLSLQVEKTGGGTVTVDKLGFYPGANFTHNDSDYFVWTGSANILSSSYDIDIQRGELDLGIASIKLTDASLDPSKSNGLKQGSRVYVRLNNKLNDADGDNFVNVFTGRINKVTTSYNKNRKVDISLTAVDCMAKAGTFPFKWAFDTIAELAEPIQWTSIDTTINGTDYGNSQVQSPNEGGITPTYHDDDMKVVDSVILSRNTQQGIAYVNKDDRLVVTTSVPSLASPEIKFTDTVVTGDATWIPYSINGIDVGFDTTRVINQVKIVSHSSVDESTYTFTNKESYELRGPSSVQIDVVDRTSTQCTAIATAILNKYEVPTVTATNITYPVKRRQDLSLTAGLDIFSTVNVKYGTTLNTNFRVTSINMRIKPNRMLVKVGFGLNRDGVLW